MWSGFKWLRWFSFCWYCARMILFLLGLRRGSHQTALVSAISRLVFGTWSENKTGVRTIYRCPYQVCNILWSQPCVLWQRVLHGGCSVDPDSCWNGDLMVNVSNLCRTSWRISTICFVLHGEYLQFVSYYMENIYNLCCILWRISIICVALHGEYL